jgi:hypothetical protein
MRPAFLVWVVKKGWRGRLASSRQPVHFSMQPSGWLAATGTGPVYKQQNRNKNAQRVLLLHNGGFCNGCITKRIKKTKNFLKIA